MTKLASLQDLCLLFVNQNFQSFKSDDLVSLPFPILRALFTKVAPLDLRRLELALNICSERNQEIWLSHYARTFSTRYRAWFKVSLSNDVNFCAVNKPDGDYRRLFLEDHFHVLLEDANRIATLLQRGVLEVNLANIVADLVKREEKACCHVKMEQIKADMLLCAPFVRSLKVSRSKSLLSPLLKDILDVLVKYVRCLKLVFLHDYRALKDTVQYFMSHGNIADFHTNWQPQRCSLPAKCSVEIFSLLAGLQVDPVEPVDDVSTAHDQTTWTPYELYDIAVTGSQYDAQNPGETFDCAAVQCDKSINHISMSSFLLTQSGSVHHFIAHTLLNRWLTLESLKLTCLNNLDIDLFKNPVVNLVENHKLRQICFEDTQFTNPMDLFISLLRVLIRKEDITLRRLTMLGIGHPFKGDFSADIVQAGTFHAITNLDLSFSSLNDVKAVPTFCEYIKRDRALRVLNLNCCKLPPGEPTAELLRAVGGSNVAELVLDFNPINTTLLEDALIHLIETNRNLELLSLTLCTFQRLFLRTRLFDSLASLPKLQKLYLAENRIGDIEELGELLLRLLQTRPCLEYVDLSSNFLSGAFLLNLATSLESLGRRTLFTGLNLSYNLDRGEVLNSKEMVRQRYGKLCRHLICMILYEDAGEHHRQEYAAQM